MTQAQRSRSTRSQSYLSKFDLVIANPNAASLVNLEVYDECFGSDHFPIKITVSLSKFIYRRKTFRIRSTQTNWEAVDEVLESRYKEFWDSSYDIAPASQKYEKFVGMLKSAI